MTAHNQCNVESPLLNPGKKENKGNDKQKRGWKDARDELNVSVETRKNLHREQMSTLPPWTKTTGGTWGRSNFSEILSEECFWVFPLLWSSSIPLWCPGWSLLGRLSHSRGGQQWSSTPKTGYLIHMSPGVKNQQALLAMYPKSTFSNQLC